MGKKVNRLISQEELKYTYESAQSRMKFHPEIATKRLKILEDIPHFDSENEAMEYAVKVAKEKPSEYYRIWATIKKDEECYRLSAPWLVANGSQTEAAEYTGFCFIENANNLLWARSH